MVLAALLLASGCTTPPVTDEDPGARIPPAALLQAGVLADQAAPLPDDDFLATDDAMRRFVAEHVSPHASAAVRLRQLLAAVMGEGGVGVAYGAQTYSAAEAFHRREANCLSFTAMFVALAREAGLDAQFQEVDIPPEWTRSGDSFVLNRHVDVLVRDSPGHERVVDFDIEDFRSSYDRRPIADRRALAHYHNNLGVERMQQGATVDALRHFRKAIEEDESFTPAWANLGSLYHRAGHAQWAVSAWRHVLDISPGEPVALSSLERAYRALGRPDLADEYRSRIERHRLGNPYFRYILARQAFSQQDYDTAIGHLRYATREKPAEERFAALLGLSYLRRGETAAAERWLARAARLSGDESLRAGYADKLDRLRANGPG
ncbi:MAG: hypothetical protein AMXMBFR8_19680 [Nevskiales bacterium]